MTPRTDTAHEFRQSPLKMALLGVLSLAMAAVGGFVVSVADTGFKQIIGGLAAAIFLLFAVLILWRGLTATGPTLRVSPEGILDVRLTRRPVPWNAVRSVSGLAMSGQLMVHIGLSRQVFDTLDPTRLAKMSWSANSSLVGAEGMAITTQGLGVKQEDLLDLITEFARRYGT